MTRAEQVKKVTEDRIAWLIHMKDQSRQKALLAELRRGVGRKPGDLPQLWGILFQNLPEEMMSKTGEPTKEEWAIYTALTLFAYHQQGRDPEQESMNHLKTGIGGAAAALVKEDDDLRRIQSRFNRFATAADMPELVTHLRSLVGMMRAAAVGMDYPELAEELYQYQFYEGAAKVRLKWGQDFYRNCHTYNKEEAKND